MNIHINQLLKTAKVFLILALIIFAISSCKQQNERLDQEIIVPVSVVELKPAPIEKHITITGTVKPVKVVEIKTLVSGNYNLLKNKATSKPFALGDYVKENQTIVLINNKEYENNIKLSSLKLNLEISNQTYEKQKSLYDKGGVTLNELKQAEINYINAKYTYDDAIFKLEKTNIKAPFSGVIVDLPYYTPNVNIDLNLPVVKLMDYSKLIMEVNLAENNAADLKKGQEVRIKSYVSANDTIRGVLSQISPAIDPESRTFKGTILVDNPDMLLRPGMFVTADIITAREDSALVITRDVIQSRQNAYVVFVVENGFAIEREVKFGYENGDNLQVVSGLNFNERLISKGFETLIDKAKVKVVN